MLNKKGVFVWWKKVERDINRGIPLVSLLKSQKKKRKQLIHEVNSLKKKRQEIETRPQEERKLLASKHASNGVKGVEFQDSEEEENLQQQLQNQEITPHQDNIELKATKSMGAMEDGDATLGSDAEVNMLQDVSQSQLPITRKPKYLNRVHTGYQWNKYNRTHYDHENPPPAIVRGYKFNIFYPDLINKSKVPTYTMEKDGRSTDTCIIRFHAGPPYQDLAFRIVNQDWQKKSVISTFENCLLRLYFNLEHYPYRR